MFPLIVDSEIHLRILHPDDAEELFRLLEQNRPRLRPWVGPGALPETAQATRIYTIECYLNSLDPLTAIETPYFDEVRPYFPPPDPYMEMGIWYRGALAGVINLSVLEDDPGAAEIGYWITEDQERKGLITRSAAGLMDHAIDHLEVERFVIGCAKDNPRSRAVPERLGYHLKEVLPNGEVVGGYVYDRLVYEISSTTWRERRSKNIP